MAPRADSEDLVGDEPLVINPYEVLGVEKTATADDIKSAYRKAALKNHPDKAPDHLKSTAHTTFQGIAFAYAILSDPQRRKRYDTTGSTSESIVDSDNFSWTDFYSEQFRDVISTDAIAAFASKYKNSDEEKDDLLAAYTQFKGKMGSIYEVIMLSNPLEDEDRFRGIIDQAIEDGDLKAFKAYTNESEASKSKRMKEAEGEAKEAEEYAQELGVAEKLFGTKGKKKGKEEGEDALKSLIMKRQEGRSSFLDNLEAKYATKSKTKGKPKGKGKKRVSEDDDEDDDQGGEPSEEAFQAAAARLKKGKAAEADTASGRKTKRTKR